MRRVSQIRTEPAPCCEIELVRSHVGESGTAVSPDVIPRFAPPVEIPISTGVAKLQEGACGAVFSAESHLRSSETHMEVISAAEHLLPPAHR